MIHFSLAEQDNDEYDEEMKKQENAYYKPSVTVDIVLFTIINGVLYNLVINRANIPFKDHPALPGGFLKKGETSEMTAQRILQNKVGVQDIYLEQLFTFDDIKRDPRGPVISVAHFAVLSHDKIIINESSLTEKPHFIPTKSLPNLAFDHNKIVKYALDRLQAKLEYTNISCSLLPSSFTLSQLQNIYEVVLNAPLDKRNFRKKFLLLGLITDTGKQTKSGRQRPARLFKFKNKKLTELKKFFN